MDDFAWIYEMSGGGQTDAEMEYYLGGNLSGSTPAAAVYSPLDAAEQWLYSQSDPMSPGIVWDKPIPSASLPAESTDGGIWGVWESIKGAAGDLLGGVNKAMSIKPNVVQTQTAQTAAKNASLFSSPMLLVGLFGIFALYLYKRG